MKRPCTRYSDKFKRESKDYIYVGKTWNAVEQYVAHMIVLWGKIHKINFKTDQDTHRLIDDFDSAIPLSLIDSFLEFMPIILKTDINKYALSIDPDDELGLRTKRMIPSNRIFIAVTKKENSAKTYYEGENFWLPLSEWSSDLYVPTYPYRDNQVIQLNPNVTQQMLKDRITKYTRNAINMTEAISKLGVSMPTLKKFLTNDPTLSERSIRTIIGYFAKNFHYFTKYDYHWIT